MSLTEEQKASLWTPSGEPYRDLRVVSARPGTGKTHTLSAYVADILNTWNDHYMPWQGIALLSYTNVAKKELEDKIGGRGHGFAITSYPHFTGTIDAFVNQSIFLPHGASMMGASKRPKMVGLPFQAWEPGSRRQNERYFSGINYRMDASLDFDPGALARDFQRRKEVVISERNRIEATKRSLNRRRFATQSDANYFAVKTLDNSPRLAQILVKRFPVIVIDEAQDMTEAQHALIDELVKAGLQHAVIIGDERQAIYEWNTAKPALFVDKITGGIWNAASLSGSFRCSPNICISLNALSGDESLKVSPGAKNGAYREPVRVRKFDANATDAKAVLTEIIDEVAGILAARLPHAEGADHIKIAILARGSDDAAHLNALYSGMTTAKRPDPSFSDKRTRALLIVAHYAIHGNLAKAFASYERLMASCGDYENTDAMRSVLTDEWLGKSGELLQYRQKMLEAIRSIRDCLCESQSPDSVKLSDCHSVCALNLPGLGTALPDIKADLRRFVPSGRARRGTRPLIDYPLSTLFIKDEQKLQAAHSKEERVRLTFSTIHGVKGETYDGVVLVMRKLTSSCGCITSSRTSLAIAAHDILSCEGKRLQYVAASRAAQCLHIAVEENDDEWKALLKAEVTSPIGNHAQIADEVSAEVPLET